MYNASQKDRYSRYTRIRRSHALMRAGLIGALLVPALLYFTAG
ncbi:hypothetical protein [Noviherbaspirillum soli]|nr:hypothetical protein [Noviherbaspirillum soli]